MNLRTESNFVLYRANRWGIVTKLDSFYCAVRNEYLDKKKIRFFLKGLIIQLL